MLLPSSYANKKYSAVIIGADFLLPADFSRSFKYELLHFDHNSNISPQGYWTSLLIGLWVGGGGLFLTFFNSFSILLPGRYLKKKKKKEQQQQQQNL